ncbi:hypothetical protein MNEG_12497 [Monoraphidium neglectum]|uniref:Uncharacterized protein n=1 Tax=Monoraphidium neglectum TaxID=145388 RepID=A0A0D2MKN4_9CHLO|nr:hypothetical protein MNEG_12497 [Monoraphidium neglectum]KIY95465.1 hypothetical protein MNEG_12497 [Monoraphidium neglectum]|eukprot:XP_013894485.1 hypothetical protein MNEG_12497 [Monoraphidium neglectum]
MAASGQEPSDGRKVLQEGAARILMKGNEVFYNEAQVRGSGGGRRCTTALRVLTARCERRCAIRT